MSLELEKKEHPSTYFVQDRSNIEEIDRLRVQDQMLTDSMGCVLPEQEDLTGLRRVLDVGCGTGGWLIEVAKAAPGIPLLAGADVSLRMVQAARAQAEQEGVSDRVEFRVMDALRMLEFPANYFDLVNLRFGVSWMRTWDWPKLLSEMHRVTCPDGIIRIAEPQIAHESSSSSLTQWFQMVQCALFRSGHLFEQDTTGIVARLVPLLTQHGVQNIQTRPYALKYQAGTVQGQAYIEDIKHAFHTLRPFLQKWGCLSENYETICKQAYAEMQQSDFQVTWNMLTVWGEKP